MNHDDIIRAAGFLKALAAVAQDQATRHSATSHEARGLRDIADGLLNNVAASRQTIDMLEKAIPGLLDAVRDNDHTAIQACLDAFRNSRPTEATLPFTGIEVGKIYLTPRGKERGPFEWLPNREGDTMPWRCQRTGDWYTEDGRYLAAGGEEKRRRLIAEKL